MYMYMCTCLPIGWKDTDVATSEPQNSLALTDKGQVVDKSICIHEDCAWQLNIQQKIIHPQSLGVNILHALNSVSALKHILSYVDSCNICCSNPDEKFAVYG